MTAGGTMADRGAMMNGDIQNLETQQVSTTSCIARTAGYRDKTLRINTLHERALKAFRSAGLMLHKESPKHCTSGFLRYQFYEGLFLRPSSAALVPSTILYSIKVVTISLNLKVTCLIPLVIPIICLGTWIHSTENDIAD